MIAVISASGLVISCGLALVLQLRRFVERNRDDTARQVQQEILAERRRFLHNFDHQVKNRLQAIRAQIEILEKSDSPPETVQLIEREILRLNDLVVNLRKVSGLATRPIENRRIDLNLLLPEVWEFAREKDSDETRIWTFEVPPMLPFLQGDWELLFLALYNLLENAVKFTAAGDTIRCRATEQGRDVVIEIADSGIGIESAELDNIWGELYRTEAVRAVPGSGLGLALVRTIVERHVGTVSVTSRPNDGSTFVLTFPVR